MSRLAVVISDLHAGSTYGLLPPDFHIKEGNEIKMNEVQEWLWHAWQDCWGWFNKLKGKDKFNLIVNGDLVEGVHHRTKEIWSVDESDHIMAAYHLLKPHAKKAENVYIVEGTEVHTKGHEHAIAYQLHSKTKNVVMPEGQGGAWQTLYCKMAETLIKADHHITTSSRPYLEASQLAIHMGSERQEAARAGYDVPKVYLRAHRHKFGHFDDGYGALIVTPPWQTKTRFARKVVPHAVPQCGMVVLDWRNTEDNSVPVVHKRLHTIKHPQVC